MRAAKKRLINGFSYLARLRARYAMIPTPAQTNKNIVTFRIFSLSGPRLLYIRPSTS